jgi:coenzyme F420-reducing hydrogenase alpha subunit
MGASYAMEMACGIDAPKGAIRDLRRMLYCGEWVESHVLHIFMLHAPDFLGYPDAMAMAKDHKELVESALRLKKIGNDVMKLIGGREIHPVNTRLGGFYKAPKTADIKAMIPDLKWGLDFAQKAVNFVATLPMPDFEFDYEFMALQHPDEYPIFEGRLTSSKGVDIPISEYDDWLTEEHVEHSTALHTHTSSGGRVHTGPMARFTLNRDKLTPKAKEAAARVGLPDVMRNPFQSIIVRAVEVVFAFEECLRIAQNYKQPKNPYVEVPAKAGTGYGATEAPRGICYHRYTIDDDGVIQDAKIVAPTSVNQATIESDLANFIPPRIDIDEEQLRHQCEQAIRNYDPCISCSAHFLKLTVERT